MALQRKPVPNLVQGVSQQAAEQRRDSQCEAQVNCMNSPKDGAVPRHGADLTAKVEGDFSTAFTYEIFRGSAERYRAIISEGGMEVYNVETGALCTLDIIAGADAYLDITGGALDKDSFVAQTVDDTTFIANKTILPAMDPAIVSAAQDRTALIFFKAGAYLAKYRLTVIIGGTAYAWTYKTPDNSAAGNAEYIDTAQLAATFMRALFYGVPGSAVTQDVHNAQSIYAGSPGGQGTGIQDSMGNPGVTLVSLGFNLSLNGNLIRINHPTTDFTVDVSDSLGGNAMAAFKGTARSFSDLPKTGFTDLRFKVQGVKKDQSDDYYVRYTSNVEAGGIWEETVGPSVKTTLKPETMPHLLFNIGLNHFELRKGVWSTRIAGDELSSQTPSFVGKVIQDIYYDHKRLGILTEGRTVWSKSENPFTFFRDTVQTVLATDPIDITLSAPGKIGLFRKAIGIDESLHLWAQGVQLRATSGNDPFRQDTVEAQPSTAYEFADKADFASVGATLFFATEPGDYASLRQLSFQNGRQNGEVDVTAHVSEYVPEGVRDMTSSDTLRLVLVRSEGAPRNLYAYNFLQGGSNGRELVQSAWNTWTFPEGTLIWASVYRATLSLGLQRSDGLCFLSLPLRNNAVDDKAAGDTYRTRMDMRITEAECTTTYDPDAKESTVVLPYTVSPTEEADFKITLRKSGLVAPNLRVRGYEFTIKSIVGDTVVVDGDLTPYLFYAGFRATAVRVESRFHLRGDAGVIPVERLTVSQFGLKYSKTGYTRIEVDTGFERPTQVSEVGGLILGASAEPAELGRLPALTSGVLTCPVQADNEEVTVRLVNDSVLPSRWQSAFWDAEAHTTVALSKVGNSD